MIFHYFHCTDSLVELIISKEFGDGRVGGLYFVSLPWRPASQTMSQQSTSLYCPLFLRDVLSWVLGKSWTNIYVFALQTKINYYYKQVPSHYWTLVMHSHYYIMNILNEKKKLR